MNHECPVCGKSGLPDFNSMPIICPQCNSDLEVLYLLQNLKHGPGIRNNNKKILIWSVISMVFLVFSIAIFILNANIEVLMRDNQNLNKSLLEAKDSLVRLDYEKRAQISHTDSTSFFYHVKEGDNLFKISAFFYAKGERYIDILKWNKIEKPYTLNVGQVLEIKLPNQK
jgi:hypothetical protein